MDVKDIQRVFDFGPHVYDPTQPIDWKKEHPLIQMAHTQLVMLEIRYPTCAYREDRSYPRDAKEKLFASYGAFMMADNFDAWRARYRGLPIQLDKKPWCDMKMKLDCPPWNRRMQQWLKEKEEQSQKFQKKMLHKLYADKNEEDTGPLPKSEEDFRVCFEKYKALLVN